MLFIPRTPEGKLITILKEIERNLATVNKKSVRLVEEAGSQLSEVLCVGDPWEKTHCQREDCSTCAPSWGKVGSCRIKNVVYSNTCLACKDRDISVRYIGETARTMFLRWHKHV